MKRNDAIDQIHKFLDDYYMGVGPSDSSELLDLLEDLGFCPPPILIVDPDGVRAPRDSYVWENEE